MEIAQVARGRTPCKYELEIIPFFAGEGYRLCWAICWLGLNCCWSNAATGAHSTQPLNCASSPAGELPSGLERVCFTWERGSKLFSTTAEAVNPHTRAVFWQGSLKQVRVASDRRPTCS